MCKSFILLLASVISVHIQAQQIIGLVKDEQGKALPGASVILKSEGLRHS